MKGFHLKLEHDEFQVGSQDASMHVLLVFLLDTAGISYKTVTLLCSGEMRTSQLMVMSAAWHS